MRKRALAFSVLSSSAVLVLGWQVGSSGVASPGIEPNTAISPAPTAPAASPPSDANAPTGSHTGGTSGHSSTGSSTAAPSGAYTGAAASTPYGDVQVRITVAGGKLADVSAIRLTDANSRSVSISNGAAPILRQEVLAAQSATVDMVSGASYTSGGYLQSLQSAMDKAGL